MFSSIAESPNYLIKSPHNIPVLKTRDQAEHRHNINNLKSDKSRFLADQICASSCKTFASVESQAFLL